MSEVSCNGCTACCRNQWVLLFPEYGDRVENYDTIEVNGHHFLNQLDNGDCVYLGENGCTIYDVRPAICRDFDCRKDFLSLTRDQRRVQNRQSVARRAIHAAARARLGTLTPQERAAAIGLREKRAASDFQDKVDRVIVEMREREKVKA